MTFPDVLLFEVRERSPPMRTCRSRTIATCTQMLHWAVEYLGYKTMQPFSSLEVRVSLSRVLTRFMCVLS